MGSSTVLNIFLLIVALIIGVGIVFYVSGPLLPFLDQQTKIILAVVVSLFAFLALYFMAKGRGGS